MKIRTGVCALLVFFCLPAFVSNAYWVWSPEQGKFVNPEGGAQDSSEEQFEYAMKLYRDKDYDKAVDQLKDLLKRHRASKAAAEAQYKLGVIYEEKGDYDKAFDAYKDLIKNYPQNQRADEVIEREFRIGNVFLSGRKGKLMGLEILPSLPRAIEIFEHIVQNAPYGAFGDQAQFRLGLARKQAGKFDQALEAFQAVIDNYPQSELVTEARFQMAETAFMRSNYQARDQRALDAAADKVDSFITRYPDSTVSEKAEKIRVEIDEKNAEKNFKIAQYYEKTKYLSSSLIYYKDVAKRYPQTQWGKKAQEKIESLQEPVAYHKDKKSAMDQEIDAAEASLAALPSSDDADRDALKRKIDRLKNRRKLLESAKKENIVSRQEDLKRRDLELKEKQKNLDTKRKLYASNKSEDFLRAMDRWQKSLDDERETLAAEHKQLDGWKESLGMADKGGFLDVLPFVGEKASELDRVRQIEAGKLFKVSDEKKGILEEKELLYKQYQEVAEMLGINSGALNGVAGDQTGFFEAYKAGQEDLAGRSKALDDATERIALLEKDLKDKQSVFESKYGGSAWKSLMEASARAVGGSAEAVGRSLDVLNPFEGKESPAEDSVQKLAEYKMHLEEKIRAQRNIVDIMNQAFDEELALQEQQRLLDSLHQEGTPTDKDVHALRKQIKSLEKETRTAYQEISDRHERIKKLTAQLAEVMQTHDKQGKSALLTAVAAPGKSVLRGGRDFLFGRKTQEARLTEEVATMTDSDTGVSEARKLKEEIELESVMIEARNQEIYQLRKELDMLKAKASLGGGYKFRSTIVTVPYNFMEEALDSARSVLPKKDRKEKMIGRLDKETRLLEEYKAQLSKVDSEIAARGGAPAPALESAAPEAAGVPVETAAPVEPAAPAMTDAEKKELEDEIKSVNLQLRQAREDYARERETISREAKALHKEAKESQSDKQWEEKKQDMTGKEKRLNKELEELKGELGKVIRREGELEKEESKILEKRINKIDQLVQRVNSKALAQDLLTERERIEERLTQIESRRSFLTSELDRFDAGKTKVA